MAVKQHHGRAKPAPAPEPKVVERVVEKEVVREVDAPWRPMDEAPADLRTWWSSVSADPAMMRIFWSNEARQWCAVTQGGGTGGMTFVWRFVKLPERG
jgi:hypothetical protein